MIDREKVIRHIIAEISIAKTCKKDFASVDIDMLSDALALLKEQENEYENGFNDAMLGKQELMYEGIDGKWHTGKEQT